MYLIFGVLTTLVNIIMFYLCSNILNIDYKISNIIAWIISVLFAFFTNKLFVFESNKKDSNTIVKEVSSFFVARIISLIIDMILIIIMIDYIKINSLIAKIISNVVVVIVNYIFSKFFIFKGDKNE